MRLSNTSASLPASTHSPLIHKTTAHIQATTCYVVSLFLYTSPLGLLQSWQIKLLREFVCSTVRWRYDNVRPVCNRGPSAPAQREFIYLSRSSDRRRPLSRGPAASPRAQPHALAACCGTPDLGADLPSASDDKIRSACVRDQRMRVAGARTQLAANAQTMCCGCNPRYPPRDRIIAQHRRLWREPPAFCRKTAGIDRVRRAASRASIWRLRSDFAATRPEPVAPWVLARRARIPSSHAFAAISESAAHAREPTPSSTSAA